MKPYIFLDTETTDKDDGRLIELSYAVVDQDKLETFELSSIRTIRVRPTQPISFEAMSVHHITEGMVASLPYFVTLPDYEQIKETLEGGIIVAHNARFDIEVLKREGIEITEFIDTKKIAMQLYPDLDSHSLQFLRYALGAVMPPDIITIVPHTSLSDVIVLIAVFRRMAIKIQESLIEGDSLSWRAIELSKLPVLLRFLPMGKYKGRTFQEINREDRGYIEWMFRKLDDWDEDVQHTVRHWMNVRSI